MGGAAGVRLLARAAAVAGWSPAWGIGEGAASGGEGLGAPPGELEAGPGSGAAPSTELSAGGPDDVYPDADESVPTPETLSSGLLDCGVGPLADDEAVPVCWSTSGRSRSRQHRSRRGRRRNAHASSSS